MKTKLRVFVILICLVSQLVIGVGLADAADPVHIVHQLIRGELEVVSILRFKWIHLIIL